MMLQAKETAQKKTFKTSNFSEDQPASVHNIVSEENPEGNEGGMHRRNFLKYLGSGIAVAVLPVGSFSLFNERDTSKLIKNLSSGEVGAWLHIGTDNLITIFTGKVEVGQNIRTSLAQVVAEELNVSLNSIKMIMGDTDLVPYDAGTFGSRSTPQMGMQLRRAAATAKTMLLEKGAEQLKVNKKDLIIEDGKIFTKNKKKSLTFGQITQGKNIVKAISDHIPLSKPEEWKIAGKSVPKVNGKEIVTGKHQFVSDMKLPGMLYGKIFRPPAYGAKLIGADTSEAKAIEDVKVIEEGDFIGVVATSLHKAEKALNTIKAEWEFTSQPERDEIFTYLKENASPGNTRGGTNSGDVENNLSSAAKRLTATYTVDYIAHAPMEPRAAVASWEHGKLTVWTGTQRPFGVRDELAKQFNLSKENVRVIMPDTGSAYGGKHSGETAVEAAKLSKASGAPVKLVWTREEEFIWAYFRPAGVIEVKGGLQEDGTLSVWEFHNYNSGPAAIRTPYEVENQQIQFHPVNSPLRQGSYRGLASTANVFAIESHMNDLAELAGTDPLEFRLKHLKEPRLKAVFEAAAHAFGWGKIKPKPDHGFGMGGGTDKGGFTATFAEVSVNKNTGEVKVIRTLTAFECGAIINPEHVENQILGSIVQGLGGALFEAIDFKDGKILNPKFSKYRVPRFKDMPQIDIITLNRTDLPSAGAGEAPIIGIAPAIRNAISNATGIKLKTLPLVPQGLTLSMR